MKNLFLLRHAKSSWDSPQLEDFDRPLSRRGVSDALSLSEYIAKHQIIFNLVLSSPSERTQSTSDLILIDMNPAPVIKLKESIYHGEAITIISLIKGQDDLLENILVIGHNPGLHNLMEALTKKTIQKVPTCSFIKLSNFDSWKDLDANILDIEFLITPKDLIHD